MSLTALVDTTPLGYDAQYTSQDTGLIYLRARTYDPATAQFMSVDPMSGLTRARYSYAEDNPVNAGDPSGLLCFDPTGLTCKLEHELASGFEHAINELTFGLVGSSSPAPCTTAFKIGEGLGMIGGFFVPGEGEAEGSLAIEDALAGLTPGNSPGVYTVDSPEELQQIYDELSAGGKPTGSSYPGQEVKLPDGTRVGIRETSKTGGPTVDINGNEYRIHLKE